MSILYLAIGIYCGISLLATLLVYGACVISGRTDRIQVGEAPSRPDAASSLMLRPQPARGAQARMT